MDDNTMISRNEWVLHSEVAEGFALMDVETGNYFHFDKTSARIWELLEQPQSLGQLCDALLAEYEVDKETCRDQVLEFLDKLAEHRLITRESA